MEEKELKKDEEQTTKEELIVENKEEENKCGEVKNQEDKENESKHNKNHKKYDVTKDKQYLALKEENEKLKNQEASLKDQLLRKQAEFENFRKRMNEDRIKDRKYALNDFLQDSIEILDIFDKAVSVKTEDDKLNKYLSGFIMINNRLKNILENNGVTKIDCLNKPFDPLVASAMETVEKEGVEPNTVIEVVMTGYMYKDRVLRPAMVKVSK